MRIAPRLAGPGFALLSALPGAVLLAQPSPVPASDVAPRVAPRVAVTGGIGVWYIHRPGFTYTRGTSTPRAFEEPATESSAIALGGGLEAVGTRWWVGATGQLLLMFFDEASLVVGTVHAGRVHPGVLGGTLRLGAGPVVVRATARPRGLLAGLCLDDCTPVVYPPPLMTGGIGLTVVQEWRPWEGVGIGLEGQLASGAQRFAGARLRVALGS
jgi:hypothetical protein